MSSADIHNSTVLYEGAVSQLRATRAGVTQRLERLFTAIEMIADASAVGLAVMSSYFIYHALHLGRHVLSIRELSGAVLAAALLFVLLLDCRGAYRRGHHLPRITETERVLRASAEAFLLVLPITFFTSHLPSRLLLFIAFSTVPLVLLTERQLLFIAVRSAWANTRVAFVPGQSLRLEGWTEYTEVDGVPMNSPGTLAAKKLYELTKRFVDLVATVFLLLLLSPFLLAIGIVVRLDSTGPLLFKQKRIGKGGKPFAMYKFRSMHTDAPAYAVSPTASDDPRITRFGRFLRRTGFDELPQLLNVLKGDMSLVGPRPEMPFIVESYNARHQQRLHVKPGITGLWQLSADRKVHIHENLEYDLYYIRERGPFLDIAILLHTIAFAIRRL